MLPTATLDDLRLAVTPLTEGDSGDYDLLLKSFRDARLMLLGIANVGTHELFAARAQLTRRLIQDMGYTVLELPTRERTAERVDRFVRGQSGDELVSDALAGLTEFPSWLWRNAEMLDFLGWLRNFNDQFASDSHKVGVVAVTLDQPAKAIVWEHSQHVGDGRAANSPTPSLGQQARDRYGSKAGLVTFTAYEGSVVAAHTINGPPRRQRLEPPCAESLEALCHSVEIPRFFLSLRGAPERLASALREPRPERMIHALYRADAADETEYVRARPADQFDALVYFDETRSLEPLDTSTGS
jgi:erythromycin esterase-like protein